MKKEIHEMNAEEILILIKTTQEDVSLSIYNEDGKVLADESTGNFNAIFSYPNKVQALYGVYGKSIRNGGQLDSRYDSDEKILEGIKRLMAFGTVKNPFDTEFKGYFYDEDAPIFG